MKSKICVKCGKEYFKPYSCSNKEWEKRKYCSRFCLKNESKFCLTCGKIFRPRGKIRKYVAQYCSISCAKKGKIPPNLKIAQANSPVQNRSKNINWKGGLNKRSLNTAKYKLWRLSVYERDNFTCQMPGCGKRGGNLEAHHIKPWADFKELRYNTENGITMCCDCHNKTKGKESIFIILFVEIMRINARK